jgi:hypothetical protein
MDEDLNQWDELAAATGSDSIVWAVSEPGGSSSLGLCHYAHTQHTKTWRDFLSAALMDRTRMI